MSEDIREAAVVILNDFARRVNSARISEESQKLKETLSEESRGRWEAMAAGTLTFDPAAPADIAILRMALLDFIADFANWDNSTVPAYLETARRLTGVRRGSPADSLAVAGEESESFRRDATHSESAGEAGRFRHPRETARRLGLASRFEIRSPKIPPSTER